MSHWVLFHLKLCSFLPKPSLPVFFTSSYPTSPCPFLQSLLSQQANLSGHFVPVVCIPHGILSPQRLITLLLAHFSCLVIDPVMPPCSPSPYRFCIIFCSSEAVCSLVFQVDCDRWDYIYLSPSPVALILLQVYQQRQSYSSTAPFSHHTARLTQDASNLSSHFPLHSFPVSRTPWETYLHLQAPSRSWMPFSDLSLGYL